MLSILRFHVFLGEEMVKGFLPKEFIAERAMHAKRQP